MLNIVDAEPLRLGWGRIWQSGEAGAILHHGEVPDPRMTVSMIGVFADPYSHLALAVSMGDEPDAQGKYPTLPDETLLAMVQMITDALACGINIIIHCLEGKYRSTYMDAAVHMKLLDYSVDQALGRIKAMHPIAELRKDSRDQLVRMQSVLRGDGEK